MRKSIKKKQNNDCILIKKLFNLQLTLKYIYVQFMQKPCYSERPFSFIKLRFNCIFSMKVMEIIMNHFNLPEKTEKDE